MKRTYSNVSLEKLCGLFGKSRQAWYDVQTRRDDRKMKEELILGWVREIRRELPKVGTLKLAHQLQETFKDHNITLGRDAFYSLLRSNDLLVKSKKRYISTTQSHHHYRIWPDLVQRRPAQKPEQLWVSDITYLRTQSGFIYLFLVTDAFSRKIVGHHLSQSLKASGCIAALQKAIQQRVYPARNLIHHSDRGIQYCCDAYVEVLQKNNINISMTQSGSPYDNAIAERVNGILKSEFDLSRTFDSYSEAIGLVARAINAYNNLRPHFSCNLLTPQKTHQRERENTLKVFSDRVQKVKNQSSR